MFLILITASIYLIIKEKKSKLFSLLIFILAGFLGFSTLILPIKNSLLPLLTGLFGSSSPRPSDLCAAPRNASAHLSRSAPFDQIGPRLVPHRPLWGLARSGPRRWTNLGLGAGETEAGAGILAAVSALFIRNITVIVVLAIAVVLLCQYLGIP